MKISHFICPSEIRIMMIVTLYRLKIFLPFLPILVMGQMRNSYQTRIQQPKFSMLPSSNVFNRNLLIKSSNKLTTENNIFNDRATILYRPQTSIILNDGQTKPGECPKTIPTRNGYYTFRQVIIKNYIILSSPFILYNKV